MKEIKKEEDTSYEIILEILFQKLLKEFLKSKL
jgi:hypothetical protein